MVRLKRPHGVVLLLALAIGPVLFRSSADAQQAGFSVLVFTRTAGFRHTSAINAGVPALVDLGNQNGFTVDVTEDATRFNPATLAGYAAVIFLNTSDNVLNASQQSAFQAYIQGGGGFVAIHQGITTEPGWPWFVSLVGNVVFAGHPAVQQADLVVEDRSHPSTSHLGTAWTRTDEWYNFDRSPRSNTNVLVSLNEASYSGGTMGGDHPVSWFHGFQGGRVWCTAMGHDGAHYAEPAFRAHLLGGIRYAAGVGAGGSPVSVEIRVGASGTERFDRPVDATVDFTQLLNDAGRPGTFDENSLRVAEVNGQGQVIDPDVPFQFDKGAGYAAATRAIGTLVFILKGTTSANETRRYSVTFDRTGSGYTPAVVPPLVRLTDNIPDEGQSSYRIETENATYFYHKEGAGFSSLLDKDGNDWIDYHPGGGSAGEFRGIPNLVYPEGYFHPGKTTCRSSVVSQGPVKVTIFSESKDSRWACRWEIYPRIARLTVTKADGPYWFLYEGTPGGRLDESTDFMVRSNGQRTPLSTRWDADLPSPEWVYFGDGGLSRVLFLVHHQNDGHLDSYWPMQGNMTVFGFGRKDLNKYMTAAPNEFTIGLSEEGSATGAPKRIDSAFRPLTVTVGSGSSGGGGGTGGNGLNYAYYEGVWDLLPDFDSLTPVATGTTSNFDLSVRLQDDGFGLVFTGFITVPTAGDYTFTTSSDDGSRLWIDGIEVVDNDGTHAARERSGVVTLAVGEHEIRVEFFDKAGGQVLDVFYEGPGIPRQTIPSAILSATSAGGGPGSGGGPGGGGGAGTGAGGPAKGDDQDAGCGATGLEALILLLLWGTAGRLKNKR